MVINKEDCTAHLHRIRTILRNKGSCGCTGIGYGIERRIR